MKDIVQDHPRMNTQGEKVLLTAWKMTAFLYHRNCRGISDSVVVLVATYIAKCL